MCESRSARDERSAGRLKRLLIVLAASSAVTFRLVPPFPPPPSLITAIVTTLSKLPSHQLAGKQIITHNRRGVSPPCRARSPPALPPLFLSSALGFLLFAVSLQWTVSDNAEALSTGHCPTTCYAIFLLPFVRCVARCLRQDVTQLAELNKTAINPCN
jgi:hypothetical protein